MTTDSYGGVTNGVETTIDSHAAELVSRGHDVTVIAPKQEGVEYGTTEEGFEIIPQQTIPLVEFGGEKLGLPLETALEGDCPEPDIVHTHGPFTEGSMGKQIAAKHDAPVISTFHTPTSEYADYVFGRFADNDYVDKTVEGLNNEVYRAIYDDVDWRKALSELSLQNILGSTLETIFNRTLGWQETQQIFAPTQQAADYLSDRINSEVDVLSNGIDTDFYKPTEPDFREWEGVPDSKNLIGYCGRLSPEKNLEDLIELDDKLDEDTELLVWGGGGQTEKYSEVFEEAGISYLGFLDEEDMPTAYSGVDVLVNPSTAETQGLTVLEANACGTPAVGADALALSETIEEGFNGYNYSRTSGEQDPEVVVDDLEEQIYTVLEEDSLSPRKFVRENHSIEFSVDKLEETYRNLEYES